MIEKADRDEVMHPTIRWTESGVPYVTAADVLRSPAGRAVLTRTAAARRARTSPREDR